MLPFFSPATNLNSPLPQKKGVNLPKQSGPPKDTTAIKHHHRRKSGNHGTFSRYLCTKSRIAAPLEAAASRFSKVFTFFSLRQHSVLEGRRATGCRETEKDVRGKGIESKVIPLHAEILHLVVSLPKKWKFTVFFCLAESCRAYHWLKYPLDLSQFRPFTNP